MGPYLITGGTGLIGNYVTRELVDRGLDADEIIVYDLYPNEAVIEDIRDDITLIEGDVTDPVQLFETFEEYRPRRVIHLAAYVAHRSHEEPTEALRINAVGTNQLFDAARITGVETCLFASTASVYGTVDDYDYMDDPIVSEEDLVKPETPYAVTKYANEVMGRTYDETYDTNYVGVRVGGAWGRGRTAGATGELNTFIRDAGLGHDVTVPPYWTMWDRINLSYGKEVGRWFVEAVDTDSFVHHVYNQGNRDPYTVDRIVETLEAIIPGIEITRPDAATDEWDDALTNPQLDCSRWYDDLGLTQEWSVEEAVVDYVNDHRTEAGLEPVSLP